MRVRHSSTAKTKRINDRILRNSRTISEDHLREMVKTISRPRNIWSESRNNRFVAEWIAKQLNSFGYKTSYQGKYANVVAMPSDNTLDPVILIGAHYDSVPGTPGADDNASAVAALLACAKAVSNFSSQEAVCFVAFNAEENGLLGSMDFVNTYLPNCELRLKQVHILEMIGYCSEHANSQRFPSGLPIRVPNVGNFLGILGNRDSKHLVENVLENARSYLPELPVTGLQLYVGLETYLSDLLRSDHAPFWEKRIPALMWTDTAEFRNPHYHQPTDIPDTLDYSFLRRVTQLLFIQALERT